MTKQYPCRLNGFFQKRWLYICYSIFFFLLGVSAWGQNKFDPGTLDSIRVSNHQIINSIFNKAVKSIQRTPDTAEDLILNGKSEAPYLRYEGKIIRNIKVEALDFERNFEDTGKRKRSLASRIADAAHTNTRAFVVRNSLFIKENTPLSAYKVADNERYLRTLNYISDARIVAKPIKGNPDSVDLLVITKDFFSISADGASDALNHVHARLVDANLWGSGQSLEVSGLYDYNRSPNFGYGALYRNNNIGPSFINTSIGYSLTNINPLTNEEESNYFVSFDRPLVSPYSHFAGGFLLSYNQAYNLYHLPDSTVFLYKYNLVDGWIGYNLGINKITKNINNKVRDRRFLSLRYFNYHYNQVPYQAENTFNPIYNDRQAILGQITFFRQDYFKTQYIYGFGTTEDLPYGYNVAMTTGWFKQLNLQRPYLGFNATRYIATDRGDFIQLFLKTGGFYNSGQLQDASLLFGGTAFSRLFFLNQTKIRQFISFSYSRLYNRLTYAQLRIDNSYGVRGFLSDSAYGDRRVSLQLETEFYLKYKILGFKFAPFPYADLSLLTPEGKNISKSVLYPSFGGGIRTRNENLIFETIELRMYYYPRTIEGMKGFKIILNSNIRYRYNSNYVTKPDVVQLNTDQ